MILVHFGGKFSLATSNFIHDQHSLAYFDWEILANSDALMRDDEEVVSDVSPAVLVFFISSLCTKKKFISSIILAQKVAVENFKTSS